MRTQLNLLFDIAGTGWASDEVDDTRKRPGVFSAIPQKVPTIFICGNHLLGTEQYYVRIRKKV
jgi:hypothetical protein